MNLNKKTGLLLFLLLLVHAPLMAQVWTGAVDSSWHTSGNWSTGTVPTSSSTVTVRNDTPFPVITSNVTVRSILLSDWWSGGSLKIRNNATLTITDDLTINGAGALYIINGHVVMDATTGGANNLDMAAASSLIDITNGSFTAGTVSEDLDVEIIGNFNAGSGDVTIYGDFDVSSGDFFNVENGTLTVEGNSVINGTFNGDDGTTNFNGTVDIRSGGILNLDTGTINFNDETYIGNSGYVYFGSGEVNISTDVDVSSGGYFNVEDATVTVTGSANFTSNGNMSVDTGSIIIGGNASLSSGGTIDLNSGTLDVGGDASFTSGGVVNAGDATINLEGDFTVQNNSNFNADSSTVVFSGDSTQTVNTNGDVTFYNVVVDSGAVLNTDGGSSNTVIIEGDLVVNEGGGVDVEGDDQIDVQGEISGDGADDINSPSPFAVSATAPSVTSVIITFNKGMVESNAENISNYSIARVSNGSSISVTNAVLNVGSDSTQVTLTISTILEDVEYEITMNNLQSNDGGNLSTNHKKRFKKPGAIIFYSITSGNWSSNSTWSRTSHSGSPATSNPGNTNNATVIVGDGDVVTIASATSITAQDTVEIKASSKLVVGTGGELTMGTEVIYGNGTFEVTNGLIRIGSSAGISASGASGNIQTTTRTFGTSGSYVYNGATAQNTGTGLPSTVQNMEIANSSDVTLTNDVEVSSTLTLTIGSLIIPTGKNLIANTKSVSSGDLIAELEITGSNGWRLISSPIDSDFDDLFDGIVTQGYPGAFYSTGSNPGDTLQPNVLYYDETYPGTDNQRWRAPASASTALTEGMGLYTYIFGNISGDSRYTNPLPSTINVQGQEFEGPVDMGVTYTTSADSGWNLVGNPYAATIDWDDSGNWTKTNIDNTIYIWDYTSNQYKTWNGVTGDLTDGLIAPFQGFWIKANDAGPSLIVDENAKTTGGSFVGKVRTDEAPPMFSIKLADDDHQSVVYFMFTEDAGLGKDQQDAFRLLPLSGIDDYLEISAITEFGDKMAINNMPRKFGIPIEIPLHVEAYKAGYLVEKPLNLEFQQFRNIPESWLIQLLDNTTGDRYTLQEGNIIPFNFSPVNRTVAPNFSFKTKPKVTSKADPAVSRFTLIITPGEDGAELPTDYTLSQNYPNPFNPQTTIELELPKQTVVDLSIYNILGQKVTTLVNGEVPAGLHTYTWNAGGNSSGIYFYRLTTENGIETKKMTLLK